jgi:PAS domain S-box-containing protein
MANSSAILSASILIVDDLEANVHLLVRTLASAGYAAVASTTNPLEVCELHRKHRYDLILLDLLMPGMDGFQVMEGLREIEPDGYLPVIVITAYPEHKLRALQAGARDFISEPFDLAEVLARVHNMLEVRLLDKELNNYKDVLEQRVRERTVELGDTLRHLSDSELRYREVFENISDGLFLLDVTEDGRFKIVEFNPAEERAVGTSTFEVSGKFLEEVIPEESARQAIATYRRCVEAGTMISYEEDLALPSGLRSFYTTLIPIRDVKGHIYRIVGIARDTTERKHIDQVLHDEKTFSDTLIQSLPDVFYLLDRQGGFLRWNRNLAELLGFSPEEMSATNALAFVHEEDRSFIAQKLQDAFETGAAEAEARLILKKGIRHYVLTATRVETQRGMNIIGIGVDITERRRSEQALERANRALLTLSACNEAVVHALNEPELLDSICRLIVETGGYRMAWVGFPENDSEKTVHPVAHYGHEEGYLAAAKISWADTELERGPVGTAIRTGSIQVIQNFLTNPATESWQAAAVKRGYQSCISLPLKSSAGALGVLTLYASESAPFSETEVKLLQELADDLAYGIVTLRTRAERDRIADEQHHHAEILRQSLEDSIKAIADTVVARDPYTAGHQTRVGQLAVAIAREMGLPEDTVHGIELAAGIHDLGKVSVPAEILSKPGRLTDIEYMLVKQHVQSGYDILKDIRFPWPIATMVWQHHERMNGSGYPQGLKGDQILLESRILAVADVVEAMASHRPYRPALGIETALEEIERGRGSTYDAAVADACLKLFHEKRFTFQ